MNDTKTKEFKDASDKIVEAKFQIIKNQNTINKTEESLAQIETNFIKINTNTQKALLCEFKFACLLFVVGIPVLTPIIYLLTILIGKSSDIFILHAIEILVFLTVALTYATILFGFGLTAWYVMKRWYLTLWLNEEELLEFVTTELRERLHKLDEAMKLNQTILDDNKSVIEENK